jgi:hypothetical protein
VQLKIARELQRTVGREAGEVLVEQGFLSEEDVLSVLKTRTLDAITICFVWTDGDFEFYDDDPLPRDLLLIEVEPTTVIMEGIYRIDEFARYRTLIPSDRSILELNAGWTSSLKLGKEFRPGSFLCREENVGSGDLLSHARLGVSSLRSTLHVDQ